MHAFHFFFCLHCTFLTLTVVPFACIVRSSIAVGPQHASHTKCIFNLYHKNCHFSFPHVHSCIGQTVVAYDASENSALHVFQWNRAHKKHFYGFSFVHVFAVPLNQFTCIPSVGNEHNAPPNMFGVKFDWKIVRQGKARRNRYYLKIKINFENNLMHATPVECSRYEPLFLNAMAMYCWIKIYFVAFQMLAVSMIFLIYFNSISRIMYFTVSNWWNDDMSSYTRDNRVQILLEMWVWALNNGLPPKTETKFFFFHLCMEINDHIVWIMHTQRSAHIMDKRTKGMFPHAAFEHLQNH